MIQFVDSFYADSLQTKWTISNGTIVVGGGRFGGNAVSLGAGGGYISTTLPNYSSGFTVSYAQQNAGGNVNIGGGCQILTTYENTFGNVFNVPLLQVGMQADRSLTLSCNNSYMNYTPALAVHTGEWFEVEVSCVFSGNPIQVTASLKVNGQLLISNATGNSGIPTIGTLRDGALANQIAFGSSNFGCLITDVVVFNNEGLNSTFAGDMNVVYQLPISDAFNNFTLSSGSHVYSLMAEIPPTGYIESSTLTDAADLGFANLAFSVGTVIGTAINIVAKKSGQEGPRSIQARNDGTAFGPEFGLNNEYQNYQSAIDGGDTSAFNAASYGVEIVV